jgi:hypothetical protein
MHDPVNAVNAVLPLDSNYSVRLECDAIAPNPPDARIRLDRAHYRIRWPTPIAKHQTNYWEGLTMDECDVRVHRQHRVQVNVPRTVYAVNWFPRPAAACSYRVSNRELYHHRWHCPPQLRQRRLLNPPSQWQSSPIAVETM